MILSDREIRAAIEHKRIGITPDPCSNPGLWSSTSLDLRLADQLTVWNKPQGGIQLRIDPADKEFSFTSLIQQFASHIPIPAGGYVLEPGKFYLGWTIEKIKLPEISRIAARVEGKSSMARLGIGVHVTAPTIHAGFGYKRDVPNHEGEPIQLEIWTVGNLPVLVKPGMKICQLIFEEVRETPSKGYEGMFTTQGPKN